MFATTCRRAFTLLELLVVIAIIAVVLGLLLAAVQKVRDVSARLSCQNRLRQIGLALHQHHDAHSVFPSGIRHYLPFTPDPNDNEPFPLMSWRTWLLPYLEQEALWRATAQAYAQERKFLEDPPHWVQHETVAAFLCPADGPRPENPVPHSSRPSGLSSFLGVQGITFQNKSGMLFLDSATRFADVSDGTSNTLLVGERPPDQYGSRGRWYGGWGYWGNADSYLGVRENFRFDNPVCPPGPYPFSQGRIEDDCSAFKFWSLHAGGANFLFVDGAVRFLPYSAAGILPALATRNGGEVQALP